MSSSMLPPIQTAFDTTESNARRNLLMFSSFIIIGWWLEINLADVINRYLGVNIEQWKLGVVYFFILVYLTFFFIRSSQFIYFSGMWKAWRVRDLYTSFYKKSNDAEPYTNFVPHEAENINQNKDEYGFIITGMHSDEHQGNTTYVKIFPTEYKISDNTISWIHKPSGYEFVTDKKKR